MTFPSVDPKQSFPQLEANLTQYWKENQTFKKSVEQRPIDNPYRFYDGPPFITGTPHYGSLLSSIVKDVVGRYWTMQGKRVERVWGWDCHGLPIEEKVQKKLWINSNKEVEQVGVKRFIDECYTYTSETSAEWGWYIDRIGRWVDMDRAYRTMDQDYMESVMWVFSELYNKGLVYEGKRVSLYSWKLGTPISNFEVAMDDSYQEVNDPAITVKFRVPTKKSTGVIVHNERGEQLLLQLNDGSWTDPGWKVEGTEDFLACAKRELFEETGIVAEHLEPFYDTITVSQGKVYEEKNYFLKVPNDTQIRIEEGKMLKYGFFPLDQLPENLRSYTAHAVEVVRGNLPRATYPNMNASILAWTTTPWTIPANMALAVGESIAYAVVHPTDSDEVFIVAKSRIETVFKGKGEYEIISEFTGKDLVGASYVPPCPEYYHGENAQNPKAVSAHHVYAADFATDTDGTGIVHIAPEFGDVDFGLAKANGIPVTNALDEEGKYTGELRDLVGTFYQDANEILSKRLSDSHLLFKKESITHRVPFCPRSGTPLVQKAQNSWFIDIQNHKDELKKANEEIYWFPEHLKHGRFEKGIESAPDWCISRTRYWGAPMPVWIGRDVDGVERDRKVFGSRAEIEAASGMKIENLHKPYIDDIKWSATHPEHSEWGELVYTRIPEVLDVWMDSGSMPYAQMHYPFENRESMEASFPADFIAEYVGQVRAWFYVMHVLWVLLKGKPAFKNVITTGTIYWTDGRKMSKSFKNYPDPRGTIEQYGADAIRFYLTNTPLLTGGDINFSEDGIVDAIKRVILPFWNTYSFFTTYANIDGWNPAQGKHFFVRHGETDANLARRLSDGLETSPLNDSGRLQAKKRWEEFASKNVKFDRIYTSPLSRASETARIIAESTGYTGKIEEVDALIERKSGKYSGKSHEEVISEHFESTGERIGLDQVRDICFGDCSIESEEQFCERVEKWIVSELSKYPDENILVVAHGWVYRAFFRYFENVPMNVAFDRKIYGSLGNAEAAELPHVPRVNPMDRWILGELHTLGAKVQNAYDTYDLQTMARSILDFMDDLTNWYVRRSRRRFWKSETDVDKASGYETLYEVLISLCKIAAPVIPFVTEHVFKNLTGKESVHLEFFPEFNRFAVPRDMRDDMQLTKQLVALGLSLRGRKKLRVRQPLASVTIGATLKPYYVDILKEELNVKEVIMGADMSQVARRICRPNARLIGPRFGKQVQEIISAAKLGNFVELEDGRVQIGEAVLEVGEFELVYEPISSENDVEGGGGQVLLMDTTITEELRMEWIARDVVRSIQDLRKEAGYEVSDRIFVDVSGNEGIVESVLRNEAYILSETLADSLTNWTMQTPDMIREAEIEGESFVIAIKRH